MKKYFLFLACVLLFCCISCKNTSTNNQEMKKDDKNVETPQNQDDEKDSDKKFNITFKVIGSFGYLNAKAGEVNKRTASTDAILAKKGEKIEFIAEPTPGFEVKEWKITGSSFSEGGNAKVNTASAIATAELTVSVEFIQIKSEEPSLPFTIQSFRLGSDKIFKLTEDEYDEIMNAIKTGDTSKTLETSYKKLKVSIWTEEDIKEVYVGDEKREPDHGEPHFFSGEMDIEEGTKQYTITLKGKNLETKLVFSIKKLSGKMPFQEDGIKLFVDENEADRHTYLHLSDTDPSTYPLIQTNKEVVLLKLKSEGFAGKVLYESNTYLFSEDSHEVTFNIEQITETEKIVELQIIAKEEEHYLPLIWHFKIVKVKVLNPIIAYLYINDELVPEEVRDNLIGNSIGTFVNGGDSALVSVRTDRMNDISSVTIDGKEATFRRLKGSPLRFRWEASIEGVSDTEKEIVIVITPKAQNGYDETTWRFKIKK